MSGDTVSGRPPGLPPGLKWMQRALELAGAAAERGEVPVGAVIVKDDKVIAEGYNLRETLQDATRHAELIAIEAACRSLGTWRLEGCDLYVTLEPCVMCAGAIWQARLARVWFGAADPKGGAMGSLYRIHEDARLNHRLPAEGGLLAPECGKILTDFFRARRV
jgi:tRNA(adenine34) deaminase